MARALLSAWERLAFSVKRVGELCSTGCEMASVRGYGRSAGVPGSSWSYRHGGTGVDVRELARGLRADLGICKLKGEGSVRGHSLCVGSMHNVTGRVWGLGACEAGAWGAGLREKGRDWASERKWVVVGHIGWKWAYKWALGPNQNNTIIVIIKQ